METIRDSLARTHKAAVPRTRPPTLGALPSEPSRTRPAGCHPRRVHQLGRRRRDRLRAHPRAVLRPARRARQAAVYGRRACAVCFVDGGRRRQARLGRGQGRLRLYAQEDLRRGAREEGVRGEPPSPPSVGLPFAVHPQRRERHGCCCTAPPPGAEAVVYGHLRGSRGRCVARGRIAHAVGGWVAAVDAGVRATGEW